MLRAALAGDGDRWWGRVGGMIAGFMAAGLPGAALGFVLGYGLCDLWLNHRVDLKILLARFRRLLRRSPAGSRILTASFALMGYAAAGTGPQALAHVRYLTELMLLAQSQREAALSAFVRGQDRDFAPDASLDVLGAECDLSTRALIVSLIIEICCVAGSPSASLCVRLEQIGERLGIAASDVERMIARHRRRPPALPRY